MGSHACSVFFSDYREFRVFIIFSLLITSVSNAIRKTDRLNKAQVFLILNKQYISEFWKRVARIVNHDIIKNKSGKNSSRLKKQIFL